MSPGKNGRTLRLILAGAAGYLLLLVCLVAAESGHADSGIRSLFSAFWYSITTLTTVVGVIPMALALGEGSEMYASIGQSIAGGLLTSTFITLFIVPVIYFIGERNSVRRKNRKTERRNG